MFKLGFKKTDAGLVLDNIRDGILVLDTAGVFRFLNSSAEEYLNLVGRDRLSRRLVEVLEEFPHTKTGRGVRGIWLSFPQSTFLVDIFPMANPVDCFTILLRDITRYQAMDEEFRREEILIMLARVAGEILHEMKGPLTGIKGSAQLMKEGFDPELVRILETETRRLEDMIFEMVEFARPAALNPVEMNVHAMLDDTLNVFRESIREKRVRVERSFDPSLPLVPADSEKLKRAVSNLVKNALEAVPAGGTIELSTRCSMDTVYSPGKNMMAILVKDNGPGLPEGLDHWLFASHRSAKKHGLGLGLMIAYRIVKEHKGMLRYVKPNTFEILLPIRRP